LLLWLAAITYLALTGEQYPVVSEVNDKLAHGAIFYLLALLLDFSFPETGLNGTKIVFLLAYGALLELAQLATPTREPSFYDLLADAAGIAAYAATVPLARRIPPLARRWQSGR
jgi:VanZ family protein